MEQFEQILNQYHCLKRTERPKTTIDTIEDLVPFSLPSDYKTFLQNYAGFEGLIAEEYINLWKIDDLIETNHDHGIVNNLPNTLGIGSNGSAEFIAIELMNTNEYRIILSPFIGLNQQYHIEIGASFTDFLVRLDQGKRWF